ncbi:recombinase family protein [Flavobacterium sp.]|uniref:recombinase family protein n=1 Tax=Flavobacterium sp. TaxID=239 RepID=UPI0028BD198E|nr:recombinase family protein [Flavobacterium sp.]
MKNVVIYTRVSTDEQAEKGFSLGHQEEALKKYCELKKFNVVNHFQDDFSAKTFDRPEWKKLEKFVKSNKSIDLILFTKWDRFSRNAEQAFSVIRLFSNMGIEVNSMEQPLDLSIPDNKVMLSMYLILPEVENDKISIRTIDGMRRAQKEGCWVNRIPYGYERTRIDNKASLKRNAEALIVERAFKEVAKGIEPVEAIRKRLKNEYNCKLEKQQFYNMLKNVVYKGYVLIKEFKKEEKQIVIGLHQPIVSEKLFDKVQEVLLGRKRKAKLPSVVNEDFPLKKNIICPVCGKQITGSKSKGNGGYYFYYHCTSTCKVRHKRDEVHIIIKDMLSQITINAGIKNLFKAILEDFIDSSNKEDVIRLNKLETELKTIEGMIENAEDKLMSNEIDKQQFDNVIKRYNARKKECENSILDLMSKKDESKKYINKSLDLICNLENVFNRLSGEAQASFLRVIYPENLVIENGGFRTNSENKVIELLTRKQRASESMEMKKATPKNGFSTYAPPLGLEPRTL